MQVFPCLMSCLVNSHPRPEKVRLTTSLQDMAASVSALEIFADRQPVDFGLTVRQGAGEVMAGYG